MIELDEKQRIIQEFVPGKQVTLAHVIANPTKDLYAKLGLLDAEGAIGILTITPSEGARWCSPGMWRRWRPPCGMS